MSKLAVRIPKPCHMTWNRMDKIENSSNRFCQECSVELADFTKMSDDEIVAYLSVRQTERTCVRMYVADAIPDASRTQKTILRWYRKVGSSFINHHLKAILLVILGSLTLTACGCKEDEIPPFPNTSITDQSNGKEVLSK